MADVELNFGIVCDLAFFSRDKTNIIGVFKNINGANFPAVHPRFSIVTEIQGKKSQYKQSLILRKKDAIEEIARIDKNINIIEDNGKAMFIGDFLMIRFPEPGEYAIDVKIDGHLIGDIGLNVIQITRTIE